MDTAAAVRSFGIDVDSKESMHELTLEIQPQPTETTCGPTCLAAVYEYWEHRVDLHELIGEIDELLGGGTLAVTLACDALQRGFDAEIVTYNLQLFDPTWFDSEGRIDSVADFIEKLQRQWRAKRDRGDLDLPRLTSATEAYVRFLELGGQVRMAPLDELLLVSIMAQDIPILCGLSATYLYQESRETPSGRPDDVGGDPTGHFVILHGYDPVRRTVLVADPLHPNPMAPTNKYVAPLSQVTSAILLGILTFDANLLMIMPADHS